MTPEEAAKQIAESILLSLETQVTTERISVEKKAEELGSWLVGAVGRLAAQDLVAKAMIEVKKERGNARDAG